MPEIDRMLRRAAARLLLVRLLQASVVALALGVGLLVVARLAERLFAIGGGQTDWGLAWAGVLGVGLLGAFAWVLVTRPDRLGVAREVDERADLRESIGTALCVMGREDGWSRATVEHARGVSRRVLVRQLFPLRAPRVWPAPIAGAVLFLVLGLLPQADLLRFLRTAEATQEQEAEIVSAQQEVEAAEKRVKDALRDLGVDALDDPLEEDEELAGASSPEEVRRAKIKQLTTLSDRLSELEGSEEMAGIEELQSRMARLKQPDGGPGELDTMVKAMQRGDFQAASRALEDLASKLARAELTDAQKEALAEQMKRLAEQLRQLAEEHEALERQLEKMGLDKALASDPDALREALQNDPNLTQEQRDQLMKTAQACRNAGGMCQSMAGACQRMGGSLASGQSGLGGLEQLAGQLTQAEMLQQEMQGLRAAQAVIRGQCQGLAGMGEMDMMDIYKRWTQGGGGSGNRGRGGGKAPPPQEADFALNPDRVRTNLDPDTPIIGQTMVRGTQIRGEARQEFHDAVSTSSKAASEAIETRVIPREFHEAIKHYFGNLERESEGSGGDDAPAEPSEEPESSSE